MDFNWCLEHPLRGGFETPKLDAAVVSLKVVIGAQIFFAVYAYIYQVAYCDTVTVTLSAK